MKSNIANFQFEAAQERKCIEGKQHLYKHNDEWIDNEIVGPDKGHWRRTMVCEHCGHEYNSQPEGCTKAKDKKHDNRESFNDHTSYVDHRVGCIKCGQMYSHPVIIDGKRPIIAKSISDVNIENGLYPAIGCGFQVKIIENKDKIFGHQELQFGVDKEISKDSDRIVRVEVIDKVAVITKFI